VLLLLPSLRRALNTKWRTREHLTSDEVKKLIEAAKTNRYGHRDVLTVLLAFRHASKRLEVIDPQSGAVDFKTTTLHVRRLRSVTSATHPLSRHEMRELRRHQPQCRSSLFVFVSERAAPLSAPGFRA
jgi:integrase